MIVIDPRAGSINLPHLFPADMVVVTELPAGDVLLTSDDGSELWTGIEFKRVSEVLSCITTGRIAGTQLPMLHNAYDDYWLLIEGPWKEGESGELLIPHSWKRGEWVHAKVGNRGFDVHDLQKWMFTMMTLTPLKIWTTQSRLETRDWIMQVAHPWWARGKDKHRAHIVTDKSRSSIELIRASLLRRVAEQLPGIGHDKALRVEAHFGDTFEMMVADVNEWVKIEGVGEKMARRIVNAIRGQEE